MSDTPRILMVDDRPANLAALEAVLAPLGAELVCATSGEEALRRLLLDEYALILLDVQMPEMDGFETARHIKQREKTQHIPIIFLTAISMEPHHALRGYTVGAVDYLFKPFDPAVLRSKVSVFLDLHRLRREAEQLAHRALHDSLTELPNRVLFMDHLTLGLAHLRRGQLHLAVTFIDLDGFKPINDRHGHDAGDRVLTVVADRLRRSVRPTDTIARLGGDEFIVLSQDLGSKQEAMDIAGRISAAIAEPIQIQNGTQVRLGASMGIAFAAGPDQSPEALVRQADTAMYSAKGNPTVSWVVASDRR
jgi:diguanylate cyclase (GGDEF)-like protein